MSERRVKPETLNKLKPGLTAAEVQEIRPELQNRSPDRASYQEIPPPRSLARHVACLWWRRGAPPRVLPDGCVDLVWTGERLVIAGPATRAQRPEGACARALKLGVRLRVGAAGDVLGMPASDLRDLIPSVAEVRDGGGDLEERLSQATSGQARLRTMATTVSGWVSTAPPPDPLIRAAASDLALGATVTDLADRLAISQRQLRRRFAHAIGYSPKTLARILRLQRFLALAEGRGGLARVAVEAGYADQPHLTRESRELTGLSPAALLAAGAGPAGERFSSAGPRPPA